VGLGIFVFFVSLVSDIANAIDWMLEEEL